MERFALRPPELDAKINLLVGSVRSGKTWGCIPKILYFCAKPVVGRRLLTGVSKASIKTNVLSDIFDLVGPRNYHYNSQSGELKLCGADWLVYGAHDEGSEKVLRGATVSVAVCDEVVLMPQNYWQMLLTRLSPPGSRLYGTTNADTSEHWLKRQYLDDEELRKNKLLWWQTFTMDDNPNLDPEYVANQKKLFTGVFYDRMILGLWNMVGGAIYQGCWGEWTKYDDDTVTRGLFSAGGTQGYTDHFIGVDYGTTNPCVFLDAIDDGRTLWYDNEYYWDSVKEMRQKTDQEYVVDLKKFIAASRCPQQPRVLVDPSAASFIAACEADGGIWVTAANNDVMDGIRRTSVALQQQKIRYHRKRCPNAIREHVGYAWNGTKAKAGIEEPIKSKDHCPDAGRYINNEVFRLDWRLAA
jgi:PBSX family phage terminase large subunit